jgi:cytochrome c553
MLHMIRFTTLALALSVAVASSAADGDITAGETKSATCAACHGADGNSATPEWPKLAGQHAGYVARQLANFKEGHRQNALMSPMAAPLSEADMADLGAYYAAQTPTIGQADPDLREAGERLYRGGNADTGVPACMACHAPNGIGNPGAGYPALRGQHAAYTAKQLNDYREGLRAGPGSEVMKTITLRLTPGEIEAVSNYLQGLH